MISDSVVSSVFKKITDKFSQSNVDEKLAEAKLEFIPEDWEDEFDDLEEAYMEVGRDDAEDQVITELIGPFMNLLDTTGYNKLYSKLAEHYELEIGGYAKTY